MIFLIFPIDKAFICIYMCSDCFAHSFLVLTINNYYCCISLGLIYHTYMHAPIMPIDRHYY